MNLYDCEGIKNKNSIQEDLLKEESTLSHKIVANSDELSAVLNLFPCSSIEEISSPDKTVRSLCSTDTNTSVLDILSSTGHCNPEEPLPNFSELADSFYTSEQDGYNEIFQPNGSDKLVQFMGSNDTKNVELSLAYPSPGGHLLTVHSEPARYSLRRDGPRLSPYVVCYERRPRGRAKAKGSKVRLQGDRKLLDGNLKPHSDAKRSTGSINFRTCKEACANGGATVAASKLIASERTGKKVFYQDGIYSPLVEEKHKRRDSTAKERGAPSEKDRTNCILACCSTHSLNSHSFKERKSHYQRRNLPIKRCDANSSFTCLKFRKQSSETRSSYGDPCEECPISPTLAHKPLPYHDYALLDPLASILPTPCHGSPQLSSFEMVDIASPSQKPSKILACTPKLADWKPKQGNFVPPVQVLGLKTSSNQDSGNCGAAPFNPALIGDCSACDEKTSLPLVHPVHRIKSHVHPQPARLCGPKTYAILKHLMLPLHNYDNPYWPVKKNTRRLHYRQILPYDEPPPEESMVSSFSPKRSSRKRCKFSMNSSSSFEEDDGDVHNELLHKDEISSAAENAEGKTLKHEDLEEGEVVGGTSKDGAFSRDVFSADLLGYEVSEKGRMCGGKESNSEKVLPTKGFDVNTNFALVEDLHTFSKMTQELTLRCSNPLKKFCRRCNFSISLGGSDKPQNIAAKNQTVPSYSTYASLYLKDLGNLGEVTYIFPLKVQCDANEITELLYGNVSFFQEGGITDFPLKGWLKLSVGIKIVFAVNRGVGTHPLTLKFPRKKRRKRRCFQLTYGNSSVSSEGLRVAKRPRRYSFSLFCVDTSGKYRFRGEICREGQDFDDDPHDDYTLQRIMRHFSARIFNNFNCDWLKIPPEELAIYFLLYGTAETSLLSCAHTKKLCQREAADSKKSLTCDSALSYNCCFFDCYDAFLRINPMISSSYVVATEDENLQKSSILCKYPMEAFSSWKRSLKSSGSSISVCQRYLRSKPDASLTSRGGLATTKGEMKLPGKVKQPSSYLPSSSPILPMLRPPITKNTSLTPYFTTFPSSSHADTPRTISSSEASPLFQHKRRSFQTDVSLQMEKEAPVNLKASPLHKNHPLYLSVLPIRRVRSTMCMKIGMNSTPLDPPFLQNISTLFDGVSTRRSTLGRRAGLGLFADRFFSRNEVITEYQGLSIDRQTALKLRLLGAAGHVVRVGMQHLYLNGYTVPVPFMGGGSFANDAGRGVKKAGGGSGGIVSAGCSTNASHFVWHDKRRGKDRVFLKALRDIQIGEEIFICYDKFYWRSLCLEEECL